MNYIDKGIVKSKAPVQLSRAVCRRVVPKKNLESSFRREYAPLGGGGGIEHAESDSFRLVRGRAPRAMARHAMARHGKTESSGLCLRMLRANIEDSVMSE